jgi:hypothetical protein
MSYRLQVLIPQQLEARLRKAAQRGRISKGEYVRRVLEESLRPSHKERSGLDPVMRLSSLNGPTADIEQMLSEIEAGHR